jgi:hypothetical protein
VGYYWPTIFRNSYKFVQTCIECQKSARKEKNYTMPLQPVLPLFPFSKWGLDFIGHINTSYYVDHIFILTTIDFFTKWTEEISLKHAQDEHVISFLEYNILSHFGILIMGQHAYLENLLNFSTHLG